MNILSMKVFLTFAFILTLISLCSSTGIAPDPYCLSKPIYKQFPLTQEEVLSHDMDDSFSGYNLDIELSSNNSFATMSKKFRELDRRNSYIPSIISHYMEHKDNGVGRDSFILFKDYTGSVHFTYGIVSSKNTLPELNSTVIVTTQKNVECFDAALFLEYGIAIVDCIKINANNQDQPFTNVFYYLSLTQHIVIKKIENEVYVNFKAITKRKLLKFSHTQTAYPYLVRAYYAEGVKDNADNTYLQIFGAGDPFDLQIFAVIDRTFFHEPKLAINDIVAYNGHIFVLDSYIGLYRLAVLKDHRILIHGRYRQTGMQKFDIYSDDLEDQTIIALANSHNVYQINWGNMLNPQVVNKYTLISDSTVRDIKINQEYVIVQSKAKAKNDTTQFEVDYTWVFTKGSRTYMNAFLVLNHNSSQVQIDFDASENHLYTADQTGLGLYKIDQARLNLHFINESLIGKSEDIVITATSTDPNTNKTVKCEEKMKVHFTSKQQTNIFQTGYEMHKFYSTNYPGQLRIPLDRKFLGPNITYKVERLDSSQIPQHWVDKVNKTYLEIDSIVRPQDITFFHTDLLQEVGQQLLIYYYEDTKNTTHVAQCIHTWEDISIKCRVAKEYQHQSRITSFTTAYFTNQDGWDYYYIMVLEGAKNQVRVIDFVRHKIVATIDYQGHQDAEIHNVASSNGFLYVLRKNVKTIDVYSLTKCKENNKCTLEFSINPAALKPLGIDYFAPEHITTDFMHPEVLFIKCLGSVLILDIDNKQKIHVLDHIISAATKQYYFRIAVNKNRMVLTAQPNIIEEYSLQRVYQKDSLILMKNYPLYGYRIQPNADIEFSDLEFLVYVNAYDPIVNVSVILIYRTGYPESAVLYDVIYLDKLYSRPGFQIQVSGFYVDFLSIAAGDQFKVYRVFEYPQLVIKNTFSDYSFNIIGMNKNSSVQTDRINVTVVNYPDQFTPTEEFNNTQSSLKVENHGNHTWKDRKWFEGHVTNYSFTCQQCNSTSGQPKVRLREHIDDIHKLEVSGNDFIETMEGGIGVHEDLYLFRHNGSIRQIINLPDQKLLQTCLKVASFQTGEFVVTACQQLGRGINLYMTSLMSFKPITWGPYTTDAYHARTLQVIHDVVMIVDQSAYPDFKLSRGSIFLYRVSVNPNTYQEFDLLDEIDNDDLLAAHGWTNQDATIGNAHLTYSALSDTFRLYITEIENGFFVIDFTRHSYEAQIHILSIKYVDMNELLKQHGLHMPSDATFQAITFTSITSSEHSQIENIIITTKGYHNFQVSIVYDESGQVGSTVLHRVYYRYAFYETYNEVKSISGYVAIGYILPSSYVSYTNYTRQYVAVYDTNDYEHESEKGYSQRYMLGAYPLNHRDPAVFAFNKTYDFHSNGTRIGLLVSEPSRHYMNSASLSKTLQVQVKQNFKDQTMNITAYNDFKEFSFQVRLINEDDLDEDQLLFIIILSIAGILTIFFVCYLCSIYSKKKKVATKPEERQSLITENQSFIDDSIPKQNQYQPPVTTNTALERQDSGYSSDEEQGSGIVKNEQVTGQLQPQKIEAIVQNPNQSPQIQQAVVKKQTKIEVSNNEVKVTQKETRIQVQNEQVTVPQVQITQQKQVPQVSNQQVQNKQ